MADESRSPAAMERTVRDLEAKFNALRSAQSTGRLQITLAVIVLMAMVVVWVFTLKTRIEENFSSEKVTEALKENAQQLQPVLTSEISKSAQELYPVYQQEAFKSFQRVGPQVSKALLEKVKALPADIAPMAINRLQQSVNNVLASLEPEIQKSIGEIPQEKEQEMVHEAVKKIVDDVQKRSANVANVQTAHLQSTLDKFDLPAPNPKETIEDHQREFLHLLLLAADQHLLMGNDDDMMLSAPTAAQIKAAGAAATASSTQHQ